MIKPSGMTSLLRLVAAEPTLLPPAPEAALVGAEHIEHRRQDEIHICLRCGQRAQTALLANTRIGSRWLDLCAACFDELHREQES